VFIVLLAMVSPGFEARGATTLTHAEQADQPMVARAARCRSLELTAAEVVPALA
jgi:hypothetical protein